MNTRYFTLLAATGLLFASCGQSETEILQDGPWNVDEILVDGQDATPEQTTWTFSEGGTFTQNSPEEGTETGTYTFDEETNALAITIDMDGIQGTLSATLSELESNSMSGTGNISVLGMNVATFSAKASRP